VRQRGRHGLLGDVVGSAVVSDGQGRGYVNYMYQGSSRLLYLGVYVTLGALEGDYRASADLATALATYMAKQLPWFFPTTSQRPVHS
jgi:hypothetical protein